MNRTKGTSKKRFIKRVGPKGVTLWTWTPELAKRSDCFEVSEREAMHIQDPVNNPAPPNMADLQHLDDNLVTLIGGLSKDQLKQLPFLVGQLQHGQAAAPETPATALDMSVGKVAEDNANQEDIQQIPDGKDKGEDDPPPVNSNGRPSVSTIKKMTKAQLQEHSSMHFPDKPEFDIDDPNNTNDFMREKINEWWDEREKG